MTVRRATSCGVSGYNDGAGYGVFGAVYGTPNSPFPNVGVYGYAPRPTSDSGGASGGPCCRREIEWGGLWCSREANREGVRAINQRKRTAEAKACPKPG